MRVGLMAFENMYGGPGQKSQEYRASVLIRSL
jgi:hypothetical protein